MNLKEREQYSAETISHIREKLQCTEGLLKGKACIYATGSFGRGEAGKNSDLDLFIASVYSSCEDDNNKRLNNLDEILLKSQLITTVRQLKLPEFDGDGEYLKQHTVYDLKKNLGKSKDDYENTFTARLLLLLESTLIVGDVVYDEIIDEIVKVYWRDFNDHPCDFKPMFLANDIQRLWRTLCVSYEAKRPNPPGKADNETSKARVKNYKLKFSRVLTCYSMILCLLYEYGERRTILHERLVELVKTTPINRVIWLNKQGSSASLQSTLDLYSQFLEQTSCSNDELADILNDKTEREKRFKEANDFSLNIAEAMLDIGKENDLLQRLIV